MRTSSGKLRNRILALFFSFILAGSFVLWGVGDIIIAPRDRLVAEVDGEPITLQQFSEAFNNTLRAYNQNQTTALDTRQARLLGLDRQVLEQLINENILNTHAKQIGLTVSTQQAVRSLQRYPAFQDAFGNFDPLTWRFFLARQGLSEAYILAREQDFKERQQLLTPAMSKTLPPAVLTKILFAHETQERIATYLVLSPPELTTRPSEEELRSFYTTYRNLFARPETRFITVLPLEIQTLLETITIPQEELRRTYEEQRPHLHHNERREVEQILFPDEQSAQEAYERLQEGTAFLTIAGERDLSAADTQIGNLTQDEMPSAELGSVVFALSVREVSRPLRTPFGYVLARATRITPPHTPTFEEAREDISQALAQERLYDAIDSLYTRIEDSVAAGEPLKTIAENLNLPLLEDVALTQDYIPINPPVLSKIPKLYETALEAREDVVAGETTQGDYYWIKLNNIQPRVIPSLQEIHEDVLALWEKKAREALLEQETQNLTTYEALDTFAEARGEALLTTPPLRRDHRDKIFSQDAMAALFRAQKDTCQSAPVSVGESRVVMCVLEILSPEPRESEISSLQAKLEESLQKELLEQYIGALRERAQIRTYDAILDSFLEGTLDVTADGTYDGRSY